MPFRLITGLRSSFSGLVFPLAGIPSPPRAIPAGIDINSDCGQAGFSGELRANPRTSRKGNGQPRRAPENFPLRLGFFAGRVPGVSGQVKQFTPIKKGPAREAPPTREAPTKGTLPMTHTKSALFVTIYRILVKGNKHYAQPSIDSMIDLLSSRHSKAVRRRWVFQCLHDLEAAGYITRRERFVKNPDGGYRQITGLISITLKGARKLFDLGVEGASRLCKEILGWMKAGDKRFPQYKPSVVPSPDHSAEGGLTPIGALFDLPAMAR